MSLEMTIDFDTEDSLLLALADEVFAQTVILDSADLDESNLPTGNDLARALSLKPDKIKGRLKKLRLLGLIQVIGANPKRYRFDRYKLERLDSGHPLFEHFYKSEQ